MSQNMIDPVAKHIPKMGSKLELPHGLNV
jgi:hypothetical protein